MEFQASAVYNRTIFTRDYKHVPLIGLETSLQCFFINIVSPTGLKRSLKYRRFLAKIQCGSETAPTAHGSETPVFAKHDLNTKIPLKSAKSVKSAIQTSLKHAICRGIKKWTISFDRDRKLW